MLTKQELEALALKTQLEAKQNAETTIITEATNPDNAMGNQGDNKQQTKTISDYLGFRGVLTNLFMQDAMLPMYQERLDHDYILPATTFSQAQTKPGQFPLEGALTTMMVSFGYGKFWKKDGILKEKLRTWYNMYKLSGAELENADMSANPVGQMVLNLVNQLNRELEISMYNGIPDPADQKGIAGIKFQFQKFNTTSTVAGLVANQDSEDPYSVLQGADKIADNSYNKTIYTASNDGYSAFAKDIVLRINNGRIQLGVDHYVLLVPAGSGNSIKKAVQSFENGLGVQNYINVSVNGNNSNAGDKLSIYSADGRMYVNEYLDIIELIGGVNEEVMLYPDVVNGIYQLKTLEFVNAGTKPQGIRVIAGKMDTQVKELMDTSSMGFEEAFLAGTNAAERLEISLQWTGQIVASGVALATMYTQVKFAKLSSANLLPDANTTYAPVNMW